MGAVRVKFTEHFSLVEALLVRLLSYPVEHTRPPLSLTRAAEVSMLAILALAMVLST